MTLCTVAHQAPLSMGFLRQEYWSGLPFLPPEDLTDLRIEPMSPALQIDSLPAESPGKPLEEYECVNQQDFRVVEEQKAVSFLVPIILESLHPSLGSHRPITACCMFG